MIAFTASAKYLNVIAIALKISTRVFTTFTPFSGGADKFLQRQLPALKINSFAASISPHLIIFEFSFLIVSEQPPVS